MQIVPQNNIQQKVNQNFNCTQQQPCQSCCQTNQAPQSVQPQSVQYSTNNNNYCSQPLTGGQYPAGYVSAQNMYPQYSQAATTQGVVTPQNIQIPANASGVNIQIFNPTVGTPGSTNNINAPCYPANYYTNTVGIDGKMNSNERSADTGNNNNGTVTGTNSSNSKDNGNIDNSKASSDTAKDSQNNNGSDNKITAEKTNTNTTVDTTEKKKTEKRKIVELTDDYIKNLETYLNSQDKQVRLNAAKEVYARLEEDDSRFDDKALTALVNKMLQDPSREIRFLALTALDGRICKGDDFTVGVLQKMQTNNDDPLNQEAADASNILLKMSAREVEKEFEVKDKPNKKSDKVKPEGK